MAKLPFGDANYKCLAQVAGYQLVHAQISPDEG